MSKDLKSKSVLNVFDNMANEYVEYFGDDQEFIKEINEFANSFDKEDKYQIQAVVADISQTT